MTSLLARIRQATPPPVRHAANHALRVYGTATSKWRPWPDFLIVGAKRGGTTFVWSWLQAHPQVLPMFPSARGNKSTQWLLEESARSPAWYRSHFHTRAHRRRVERSVGPTVTGEASPWYMYAPHGPSVLLEHMPQVKVIALLRDPVVRAHSHWRERRGQGTETLTFEEALDAEDERTDGEWDRMESDPAYYSAAVDHFAYRDRGIYLPQVRRLRAAVPPAQLLILRSEDLYEDPDPTFNAVSDFLGIARRPQPPRSGRNSSREKWPLADETREALAAYYRPHNEALERELGRPMGWTVPTS